MKTTAESPKKLDLITIGQTYVDLCGEQEGSHIKDMISFKKYVGGFAPSIAVGCTRLGLHSALISQVGQDGMGDFVTDTLTQEKINIDHLILDPKPTAVAFRAIDYKQHLIAQDATRTNHKELTHDISHAFIAQSNLLLITSSAFSDNDATSNLTAAMIKAKESHTKVVLIVDHLNATHETEINAQSANCLKALPHCDLIIATEIEIQILMKQSETHSALTSLRAVSKALIVIKLSQGCVAFDHLIPSQWQNSIGHKGFTNDSQSASYSKEAFITGFLYGWHHQESLEKCCLIACACVAITQTRPDNITNLPCQNELKLFLSEQNQLIAQTILTPYFKHLHYSATKYHQKQKLFAISLGYHQQWLKWSQIYHVDEKIVQQAKTLLAKGLAILAHQNPEVGLIDDDCTEFDILSSLPYPTQIARTIELPGEIPLQLKQEKDLARILMHWPKHHRVKVAVTYHPDDRYALRGQQEATLNFLYNACQHSQHELLIELTPPANSLITASTIANIMSRFYETGIYPDWWQITPPRDQRSWDSLQKVIEDNDGFCRGVLLNAQLATTEQIEAVVTLGAKQPYCNGFVVGKSMFQNAFEQWFAQKIADQSLIEMIAAQFEKSLSIWKNLEQKPVRKVALEENIA